MHDVSGGMLGADDERRTDLGRQDLLCKTVTNNDCCHHGERVRHLARRARAACVYHTNIHEQVPWLLTRS